VVDDNATNRRVLVAQCASWGMDAVAVSSGQEALTLFDQRPFDLVILDGAIPGMDGPALAAALRERMQSLPLILLTSVGDMELRRRAEQHGVAAFLTKPVKQSQLFDSIAKAVSDYAPRAERVVAVSEIDPQLAQKVPLTILLAEDNAVNQKVALHILKRLGYRAEVAANGLEVLKALELRPYDVILMDVQMPEMDGLEATRQLRRSWTNGRPPRIVAMTANAMQGDREMCLEAGMDDYVAKPIQIGELVEALKRAKVSSGQWASVVTESPVTPIPARARALTTRHTAVSVLDPQTLGKLRELTAGEPEMLAGLIRDHLENSLSLVEQMRASLLGDDAETLERAAHSLKSSTAMFGALKLSKIAGELEAVCKDTVQPGATEVLGRLEAEYQLVRLALNGELSRAA
jgi:CheY-like chemotaxis protein/HPt (histidine-containing phosphotransfer) domain-containing protein